VVDHRFRPYIQPFGHLIEVKGAEREELEDTSSIFIPQNVKKLNRIQRVTNDDSLKLWVVTLGYKSCGLDRTPEASIAAAVAEKIGGESHIL
jgi:hypothetical protein